MQYHFVTSLDELSKAAYGIKEPPAENPVYQPEKDLGSAVCFVPALVYDKNGYRSYDPVSLSGGDSGFR